MLAISINNARQAMQLNHPSGALEFGRGPQGELPRFIIDDAFVSRDQLRIEELSGGRIQLRNLSTKNPIELSDGAQVAPTEVLELALPVQVRVGETTMAVALSAASAATVRSDPASRLPPESMTRPISDSAMPAEPGSPLESLAADGFQSIKPVQLSQGQQQAAALPALGEAPSLETLAQWMETVLALQRSNAGPNEFFAQSARAMVDMVGLDVGLMLIHEAKGWKVVARAAREHDESHRLTATGREFSQTVLRQVLAEKQTFYQDLALMKSQESLQSVDAVVVSPIFGLNEEVVGVLYGLRRSRGRLAGCKIQPLEAQLVQLLAAAVGANLARTVATRTRTQFEQFFSAELVRELERDPALLEGRGRNVTILMSDLRGFSSLSERLGPEQTCRLVRDVMERLSERIVQYGGVIVAYMGDGILAMWNAPIQQDDHPIRACRAALAMLKELPGLNATWQPIVGHPLGIGIGINTGPAQVGNTGSSRKFMYGPLGNTVNLASRVEGATKYLGVPILVTGFTRAHLGDAFVTRRLCQVRVVGIREAVHLHELQGETATQEWTSYRDAYESALSLFESQQWLKTCQTLLPLLEHSQAVGFDHATMKLLNRSMACLTDPPDPFDPVLELSSK